MRVSLLRASASLAGIAALALCAGSVAPAKARDGVNAAIIGGAAAGMVGGVVAGALLNEARPAPGYAPPPPPRPVYVQERPVVREVIEERPVVREVVVRDDAGERAFRLHEGCDAGDRRACVKLGILIGQHQEQRAEWQRVHPEMFTWDR